MTDVTAVAFVARHGLAFPAAELSYDRWPTAPMGISAGMRAPRSALVPAPCGRVPLQVEGWGNRLARDRPRPGQAPGRQRGLWAWGAERWRPRVQVRGRGQESRQNRGDARGLPECLQSAGSCGGDRVEAGH